MKMNAVTAYLGLGSNIGRKKKNLLQAVKLLNAVPGVTVKKISRFYRTKPMYYEEQPDFCNAVVKIKTTVEPEDLYVSVKKIEKRMGRRSRIKWGPRIIDIDILLYGNRVIRTSFLTIPHSRMHERPFVLEPLLEIAPQTMHPLKKKRCSTIFNQLKKDASYLSYMYS